MRNNSLWGLMTKDPKHMKINELTLVNYFNWIKNLALSMFEWEGMPETIDLRYLEESLFTTGKLLFFEDPTLGHLALTCLPSSDINVYGRPIQYNIRAHSYQKTVLAKDSVLIINNDLEEPSMHTVGAFASRLSEIERTTDINLNAQKTPILILTDDKQIHTLKNIYNQYQGNAPVIYADKNLFSNDSIKVLPTLAPYIVDKLDQHKLNLWNEMLTFLGIQNTNSEKKERLIVDEVNANNEHVDLNAEVMLKNRKEACTKINEMFNLNVSVKLRYQNEDDLSYNEDEDEGDDYE